MSKEINIKHSKSRWITTSLILKEIRQAIFTIINTYLIVSLCNSNMMCFFRCCNSFAYVSLLSMDSVLNKNNIPFICVDDMEKNNINILKNSSISYDSYGNMIGNSKKNKLKKEFSSNLTQNLLFKYINNCYTNTISRLENDKIKSNILISLSINSVPEHETVNICCNQIIKSMLVSIYNALPIRPNNLEDIYVTKKPIFNMDKNIIIDDICVSKVQIEKICNLFGLKYEPNILLFNFLIALAVKRIIRKDIGKINIVLSSSCISIPIFQCKKKYKLQMEKLYNKNLFIGNYLVLPSNHKDFPSKPLEKGSNNLEKTIDYKKQTIFNNNQQSFKDIYYTYDIIKKEIEIICNNIQDNYLYVNKTQLKYHLNSYFHKFFFNDIASRVCVL